MSEDREPDLTLIEADMRNVATLVELTAELRRIDAQLQRLRELVGEAVVQLDRLPVIERWLVQIGFGLGVRL